MSQQIAQELNWQELPDAATTEITREAKRYCPEFPFEPTLVEKAADFTALYQEYELVRLVSTDGPERKEVWGFYADGDFRPIDGSARMFEELNELAPLNLTYKTVLAYTALRLRFELAAKVLHHAGRDEFRLAQIVSTVDDLPAAQKNLADELLQKLFKAPEVVMVPEWEEDVPPNIQRGLVFRVVAFAAVNYGAVDWSLKQVFVEIEADGTLTTRSLDTTPYERVPLEEPEPVVCASRRVQTALPFQEWRVLDENETDQLLQKLDSFGNEVAVIFDENDLKNSAQLAHKLKGGWDPVSKYLQQRLKAETRDKLKRDDLNSPEIKQILIKELNRNLGGPLYETGRFAHVPLSEQTQRLLARKAPDIHTLHRLNRSLLVDAYPDELNRKEVILRGANLRFYEHCELVEILISSNRQYQRSYAIREREGDKPDLYPMRGTSDVLYEINKRNQLILDEATVDDYLRFYCWTTHGNDGPFYVPRTFREIPFRTAPSEKQRCKIRQIDFNISSVTDEEKEALHVKTSAADFHRKAHVAYASTIFQEWFAIEPDGVVQMLKREPRIADLAIQKEKYGVDLIELLKPVPITGGHLIELKPPDGLDQQSKSEEQAQTQDQEESRKQQDELRTAFWPLSLTSKVVVYEHLKNLQNWLKPPVGERVSPDPPKVERHLKKVLTELFDNNTPQNAALEFLKAQLQPSSGQNITADLWESLETLIYALRPYETATPKTFRPYLAQAGEAFDLFVDGEMVLDSDCIGWRAFQDAEDVINSHPHLEINIFDCWFKDTLKLTKLENGPALIFNGCVFEQGVFAREAEIRKDLQFENCVFLGASPALNLENAHITGNLQLTQCLLRGPFYAPRLRAENHVQLIGCGIAQTLASISEPLTVPEMLARPWPDAEIQFEQDPSPGTIEAVNLTGAKVGGNLEIRATDDETYATIIEGVINGDDIEVGQNLALFGTCSESNTSFARAHVSKGVYMNPLRILDGRLNLQSAIVDGDVYLRNANIGGAVNLYQITVGGNLNLLGLKTHGNLELIFANIRGFVAAYHTSADTDAPGLCVRGDLILSGMQARMLELRGATITGKVRVITGKFGRFTMTLDTSPPASEARGPVVNNNGNFVPRPCSASLVEITSVIVEENLDLSGLVVKLPPDERKASRLRMDHQGIAVLLNNSQIGRDLTFFSERVRVNLERRWKDRDEKILPWQKIPTPTEHGSTAWGNLVLKSNDIGGGLDLRHLIVNGNIDLSDTSVKFDVNMDAGHPDFDGFQTTCNSVHAAKLVCSGDLKLSGLKASQSFLARHGRIKGEIVFLPSKAKERLGRNEAVALQKISPATIERDLDLSSVDVGGDLDLRNLRVKGDVLINDTNVGLDLNMDGTSFAGYATECNNVNAEGLKCNGEVKLSGLKARGDFRGRNMQVGSDIAFLIQEQTTDARENGNNASGCQQRRGFANIGGYIDLTAAKANRLTLSGDNLCAEIRAEDLDLSKLRQDLHDGKRRLDRYLISRLPQETQRDIQNGTDSIPLQEALVSELNEMLAGASLYQKKLFADVMLSRDVRRLVNTTREHNARLNRRLLEECYGGDQQKQARVRLERSNIGYLEIWKPPVLGRVNLSGISVTHWIFSNSNNNSRPEPVSGNDYIDILNGLTPFDRSTWIDVEKALRNQSQFADANKVYREMRKRINSDTHLGPLFSLTRKPVDLYRRSVPEWLGRFGSWIKEGIATGYRRLLKPTLWHVWDDVQYALIGYGTKVWIPMIPAVALFILSWFIFSDPAYVRASPSLLQVMQQPAPAPSQQQQQQQSNASIPGGNSEANTKGNLEKKPTQVPGVQWTWRDGAVLSLRYHVPILTSLTHGWWEASSEPLFLGFTAEHYAFIVEAYHWIAWPIFLLGAAAQVFRGKET